MPDIQSFQLLVHDASNIDTETTLGITSLMFEAKCYVEAAVTDGEGNPIDSKRGWVSTSSEKLQEPNATSTWNATLDLGPVSLDSRVEIVLKRSFALKVYQVGRTVTTVQELLDMDEKAVFLLFNEKEDVVPDPVKHLPALVRVSAKDKKEAPPKKKYDKHLMIITRGTRGDVQPFVALARGLAEMKNWEITFVTETTFKANIKKYATVEQGAIHWRPSGGDTMTRVNDPLAQKAINLKISAKQTNAMQKIFLARSEIEFFPSEPAIYYWAKELKPDYLMFGFTMVSISMIASEALGIPLLGFVLQPTSIPSIEYPPVIPLKEANYKKLTEDSIKQAHEHHHLIKYCMDNTPVVSKLKDLSHDNVNGLASLRERRGLHVFDGYEVNAWQELLDGNYPLIIPINETMYGGKPKDWSENTVFTDCIFLRGDSVPPIADDAQAFLDKAKGMDGKVVVLAFSSMPVSKSQIVSIALKLVQECKEKVCVFALVGKQLALPLDDHIQQAAQTAQDDGRLFIASGAPFGRLFSLVDAVVLHGGLGTTSETLQAEIPAIVTGVLLLDQRFWGARCSELKVGPFGVHIDDFSDTCVDTVDKAVASDSVWRTNAQEIGKKMKEQAGEDVSGVQRNVEWVLRLSKEAKPYKYETDEELVKSGREARGAKGVAEGFKSLIEDFYNSSKAEKAASRSTPEFLKTDSVYLSVQL